MSGRPTEPPRAVWALFTISLGVGLALIGLFSWIVLAFGGLSKLAVIVAAPGAMLIAGAIGILSGRPWTKRTLGAAFTVGASCSALAAWFLFLARDGFGGVGGVYAAIASGLVVFFLGMIFLLRSPSVDQHFWATAMSGDDRSPDEVLLDEIDEVALDFGSEELSDEASEVSAEQQEQHETEVKL